jgi:hypothetical protein
MVQTRAFIKKLYDTPIVGYSHGTLDDGTEVSVEIITKQGETECYNYNGNILISANNFKVNTIKPLYSQLKQKRFSNAKIISYRSIPNPNLLNCSKKIVSVSFGDNTGPIIYFDMKH